MDEMPQPRRDPFTFHGQYSASQHTQDAARSSIQWLGKNHPEFVKNGMGVDWRFQGQAREGAIKFGNDYYDKLSPEQREEFDSHWQTVMGEHTGAKEFGAKSELSVYANRLAARDKAIASAQVERAKQTPSIKQAEASVDPVDIAFPESRAFSMQEAVDIAKRQSVVGGGWDSDEFAIRSQQRLAAAKEPNFAPGDEVNEGHISEWKNFTEGIGVRTIGGSASSKLGQLTPTKFNGRKMVAGEYRQGDIVTASEGEVDAGVAIGREAIAGALSKGGLVGMSGISAHASIGERVNKLVNAELKKYEEAASQTQDPAMVKETVQRIREVANDVFDAFGGEVRATTGYVGNAGDFRYNAARLAGGDLTSAASRSAGFRDHLIKSAGSINAAEHGPAGVYAGKGEAYRYGEGAVWGGGGGGRSGSGGGGGYGQQDESLPDWFTNIFPNAFKRSPYQGLAGRFMMTQFMTSMAWQGTGGQVFDAAESYGSGQSYMAGMTAFGSDGVTGGAAGYSARMALREERAGEIAYNQYGVFNELGGSFSGGKLGGLFNDAKVGAGVGLGGGIVAGALGLPVAPVAVGAGLLAAAPGAAMSIANLATDRDSMEGASFQNWMRASLIAGGLDNKVNWTDADKEFYMNRTKKGYVLTSGEEIGEYLQNLPEGVSEADLMRRGDTGAFIEQIAPGFLDSLAYTEDEARGVSLSTFNRSVAEKYGADPKETAKVLSNLQVGFGGMETDEQRSVADQMVGISLDTGKDQVSLYSQFASLRGVAEGSDEWFGGAETWTGVGTEAERVSMLRKQQKMSQAYSQFSPYLEGGTHTAAQLADQFGLGQMASAQAFAQVATGFGMDNGRDMTDLEATGFAGMMGAHSPRVNMKLSSIASNVANLGAGDMADTFASLSGAVSKGVDQNFLSELFSGNLYALSDVGQYTGQGNLQYYQDDGRRMGTTDISGVVLGAQQRLGLPGASTTRQTLGAMGLSFGEAGAESALISGGLEGYEKYYNATRWSSQQQSFGMQQAQLGENARNMYATWGIQDQITEAQFSGQMNQFGYSLRRMDTQHQFQLDNWAAQDSQRGAGIESNRWRQSFDHQTSLMQRDFTREGWGFQTQMSNLSHGWSMEDYDEGIRRSSGYERAQLIKRRDREVTSYSLNSSNTDNVRENQEELWEREDERYRKSIEYSEQMIQLEDDNIARQRAQYEALFQMDRENTVRRKDEAVELHALQMKLQEEQRKHQEKQLAFSRQSLDLQIEMARQQHEYTENVRAFTQSREKDEAAMRKLIGYAPVFSRMVEDWVGMIDRLERSSIGSLSNSFGITR
jgi:hypothetical protein